MDKQKLNDINANIDKAFDKIKDERIAPSTIDNGVYKTLDASSLYKPPFKFMNHKKAMLIVSLSALIALILLIVCAMNSYGNNVLNAGSIDANIQRSVDYQIPQATTFLSTNQVDAQEILTANSMQFVDITSQNNSSGAYDLYKIPIDCDAAWAKTCLDKGFNKMGVVDASKLLNGGWQLTADKESTDYVRIRFADFKSANPKAAIDNAFKLQNFEQSYQTNDDVDELGNTYIAGTAKYENRNIAWRVAAIPIVEVYNIGLPETGIYVGIRVEYL